MQFHKHNIEPEFQKLTEEFPEIFLNPSKQVLELQEKHPDHMPPKELLCNLRFGFECGAGWIDILRDFCREVTALVQLERDAGREAVVTSFIVKEKFGALRWQGDHHFENPEAVKSFSKLINRLEEKSLTICEVTGKNGKLCGTGWVKTLCEEEAKKRGYDYD